MLSQNLKAKSHTKTQNAYYDSTVSVTNDTLLTTNTKIDNLDDFVKEEALPILEGSLDADIDTVDKNLRIEQRNLSIFLSLAGLDYTMNNWRILHWESLHHKVGHFDLTNYRYYAQIDGFYDVKVLFAFINSITIPDAITSLEIAVYRNGSPYKLLKKDYSTTGSACLNGSCLVYLEAGEYLDIRFRPKGSGTMRAINFTEHYGYLDIHYSGNHNHLTSDLFTVTWSL